MNFVNYRTGKLADPAVGSFGGKLQKGNYSGWLLVVGCCASRGYLSERHPSPPCSLRTKNLGPPFGRRSLSYPSPLSSSLPIWQLVARQIGSYEYEQFAPPHNGGVGKEGAPKLFGEKFGTPHFYYEKLIVRQQSWGEQSISPPFGWRDG